MALGFADTSIAYPQELLAMGVFVLYTYCMVKIGLSDKYWKKNISTDPAFVEAENRRLAMQALCPHEHWSTRCGCCGMIMASDATSESEIKMHEHIL